MLNARKKCFFFVFFFVSLIWCGFQGCFFLGCSSRRAVFPVRKFRRRFFNLGSSCASRGCKVCKRAGGRMCSRMCSRVRVCVRVCVCVYACARVRVRTCMRVRVRPCAYSPMRGLAKIAHEGVDENRKSNRKKFFFCACL